MAIGPWQGLPAEAIPERIFGHVADTLKIAYFFADNSPSTL
jgi:hypothetical protein